MIGCIIITYVCGVVIFSRQSVSSVTMSHYCQARVKLFWPVTSMGPMGQYLVRDGWYRDQPRTITIVISHRHTSSTLNFQYQYHLWLCNVSPQLRFSAPSFITNITGSHEQAPSYKVHQCSGLWHNFIQSSERLNIESGPSQLQIHPQL